jgi:glycerol-3-phosphate dehydrogenase (NAD(P)+)
MTQAKATTLGVGGWGITLANLCRSVGLSVVLWEFDPDAADKLRRDRVRDEVLPGVEIHRDVVITHELDEAVKASRLIFLVIPSHVVRSVLRGLNKITMACDAILINCTKGLEIETQMRISELAREELVHFDFDNYVVLSGPSHAEEVSRNIPTAVVVASSDIKKAKTVQKSLNTSAFRLYTSRDVIGVEIGGALKNIIAIAAGICDGTGFGDNTKAALLPRGLAEIVRLGRKAGADPLTFSGLSGMGDLVATCMSRHSRNRYVGEQIGKGRALTDVLSGMTMVAEGVKTCKAAQRLARKLQVEMPICHQVHKVLFDGKEPKQAMQDLMTRKVKSEIWY